MKKIFLILSLLIATTGFSQNVTLVNPFVSFESSSPIYNPINAANPVDEANATTGFDILFGDSVSFTSVSSSPSPQNGTYSIIMEHIGGTNEEIRATTLFTVENGQDYQVEFYVNEVNGTNWEIGLHGAYGWVSSSTVNPTSVGIWTKYTFNGTTDATTAGIWLRGNGNSDGGNKLGIDNIVITKQ